ncbi:MAG: glycosyltransferase [Desulfovibrio sp.]|nr:glycosyltransferase [Desulfovibrio sp.]
MSTAPPAVHLGMVTWNRLHLTRIALESLLSLTPPGYGLTIVDNGSQDGTQEYLQETAARYPHIRLKLLSRNMGIGVASNLAWDDAAQADFYVKIDNDIEILSPQWLARLLAPALEHGIWLTAYRLCAWHGTSQDVLLLADGGMARITSACGGGCIAIPQRTHEKLGFWNEGYGRYGYEDVDYSWRADFSALSMASLEPDGLVRHLGYAPGMVDAQHEADKKTSIASRLSGETAWHCYRLLFHHGLLPLYMGRKYLPAEKGGLFRFTLDPGHKAVQKLLNDLVRTIPMENEGNVTRMDLRAWKDREAEHESH